MNAVKSGSEGAVLRRKQQRRAAIQWFGVALIIGLAVFGTFLYLISKESGDQTPGGGHSGLAPTSEILLTG